MLSRGRAFLKSSAKEFGMTALLDALSATDQARLRDLAHPAEDIHWPSGVARSEGWRVANEEYHRRQRDLGRREMQALMASLHLASGMEAARAREVVMTATELYLQTDMMRVVSRIKDGELRLYSTRCPLYERFLDHHWGGLTACGCFARRQGWFDALGADLEEELLMNRKWGDPVCQGAVRGKGQQAP
jgi:hypothetical protein